MDKGLKILEDLKKKSDELGIQRDELEAKIQELIYIGISMNNDIASLKLALEKLKEEKAFAQNAPKEYKKERKKLIKWISIVFSIVFVLFSVYTIIGNIESINILKTLLVNLLSTSLATGVPGALMFVEIVKKYKTRQVSDIDKEIEEKQGKLEATNSEQNEISNQVNDYVALRANILSEFYKTNNKISAIEELRAKVIEDFCKDNLEIHALLNDAYDEEFEKENKQKVKK